MRLFARLIVASSICLAFVQTAWAEDDEMIAQGVYNKDNWPLEVVNRPLTLAAGMAEIGGDTFILGISGGDVLDPWQPIVLAPELRYGLSGQLQLGITHTNHATFFPPSGFCVSGEDNGCAKTYNATGAEAEYALTRGGNVNLSARGGLTVGRYSPDFAMGLTAGLKLRFRGGKIAVIIDPNVYIGVIERDTFPFGVEGVDGNVSYPDYLFVPVHIQYQLNTQAMFYLLSGLNTPFKDMGDLYQIPVGLGTNYSLNNRMDAGLELQISNLAGKDIGPDGAQIGKFDERYLIARIAIRI